MPSRYGSEELTRFAAAVLAALGASDPVATEVAQSLVLSNLTGHDSHGIIRLVQYAGFVADGQIRPAAAAVLTARHGATGVVDAGWGFGQPAALRASRLLTELAHEHGAAAVTIRNCNHIGRLGEYVGLMARAGLAALAFCNSGAVVAPYGGSGRALGTNPIAWAAPGGADEPLVVDFATASVAEGKLKVAEAEGGDLPEGLILDARGCPARQPADFYAGGALLPFGGHKGSGLSIMIELLGGLLTGMGTAPTAGYAGGNGTVMLAVDVMAFVGAAAYRAEAREFSAQLVAKGAGPTGGHVLLPGEPESRTWSHRLAAGIPLGDGVQQMIFELTDPLHIKRPEPLADP
jgi:uncharacterized oxidoreductase